jgi:predicted RNase H-like HicB family nuclease
MKASKKQIEEIVARPYSVEFEYGDSSDEGVLAFIAEWPDCFAAGRTREKAVVELDRTMRELVVYRVEHDLDIPEPDAGSSGRVLLRLPRKLHHDAERRASLDGVSLNTWLTTAIARELGPVPAEASPRVRRLSESAVRYNARGSRRPRRAR